MDTQNPAYRLFALCALLFLIPAGATFAWDAPEVSITDRTGETWDITQAASLGFKPRFFQYGIGRDTIRALDDSEFRSEPLSWGRNPRVIAVSERDEARAYSVPKLVRHEIANSRIKDTMIAAAY
jgi:hypothetical protein